MLGSTVLPKLIAGLGRGGPCCNGEGHETGSSVCERYRINSGHRVAGESGEGRRSTANSTVCAAFHLCPNVQGRRSSYLGRVVRFRDTEPEEGEGTAAKLAS